MPLSVTSSSRAIYGFLVDDSRRITDHIQELFARTRVVSEEELPSLIVELQAVISEYLLRLQNRASAAVLHWPDFPRERRKPPTP